MSEPRLPTWLTKPQEYEPPRDRDAFLDRSILSMLSVLGRIRRQGAHSGGRFQPHTAFGLGFALLMVLLVSLAHARGFVLIAVVALLVGLCLLPARQIAGVLRNGLIATAFSALVLLPAGLIGNWYSMFTIPPKVFFSVSLLSMLAENTRWEDITRAAKTFFVPDLFLFVLDIAVKYVVLLGEFSLNMLYAVKLRSVGRNRNKHAALSGIAGTMFLRSRQMAEEMHAAMECRGFTGEYRRPTRFAINPADLGLIVLAAGMVLLYIYFLRRGMGQ